MDNDKAIFFTKIDYKTERYDDMIKNIKFLTNTKSQLNKEEQNLLYLAYRNAISIRRKSLRNIKSFQLIEVTENELNPLTSEYKFEIEDEIKKISMDILTLLDQTLIPSCADVKSRVFYLKLKGDFNRYLAEISMNSERKEFILNSVVAYKDGSEIATNELTPTDPLRLGLALNFAVFFYEILEMHDRGLELLKCALSDALILLDTVQDEDYQDVMLALQLIRDNIYMWSYCNQN